MARMATNQNGDYVFIALEKTPSGNQVVFRVTRPTSTTPTQSRVYNPLDGSAANVAPTANLDRMVFYGNFGTNVGVIDHAIATPTNTDITMATIGNDVIQPLVTNPSDDQHFIAINQTDQDALETTNRGSTWATLNAALGQTVEAMDLYFKGQYYPLAAFIGGDDGTDSNLTISPNDFDNLREDTSAALQAATIIRNVDIARNV